MQVVLLELEVLPKSAEQLIGAFPPPSPLEVLRGGGAGGPLFSRKED